TAVTNGRVLRGHLYRLRLGPVLGSGGHGVDSAGLVILDHSFFEHRAVTRGTDEHGEFGVALISEHTDVVVECMEDVIYGDASLRRAIRNPHKNNLSCFRLGKQPKLSRRTLESRRSLRGRPPRTVRHRQGSSDNRRPGTTYISHRWSSCIFLLVVIVISPLFGECVPRLCRGA